jgi:hypothetical protein
LAAYGDLSGNTSHHFANLARFALDRITEDERAITHSAREFSRSLE